MDRNGPGEAFSRFDAKLQKSQIPRRINILQLPSYHSFSRSTVGKLLLHASNIILSVSCVTNFKCSSYFTVNDFRNLYPARSSRNRQLIAYEKII